MSTKKTSKGTSKDCHLFTITQHECAPVDDRVTCWPIDRIFRQCGLGPAIEVTNALLPFTEGDQGPQVNPAFLNKPPKGKKWSDIR